MLRGGTWLCISKVIYLYLNFLNEQYSKKSYLTSKLPEKDKYAKCPAIKKKKNQILIDILISSMYKARHNALTMLI